MAGLFVVVFYPFKLIYRFSLKTVLLGLYQLYFNLKKTIKKNLHPTSNKFFSFFSSKYVIHVIVIIIALLVTTNSISAETANQEEFGGNSLLQSVVKANQYEQETIETAATSVTEPSHYYKNFGAVAVSNPAIADYVINNEAITTTATGGGSIVKPTLATTIQGVRPRETVEYYTVQGGDTISTIAQKFGISTSTILWESKLDEKSLIRPGDQLTILPVSGVSHRIQSNDTMESIAKKYKADVAKIIEYNKLASADSIAEGEVLIIPDGSIDPPPPVKKSYAGAQIYSGPIPDSARVAPGDRLLWPTPSHKINQYFTWRHGGIDMDGNYSSPIYAAASGTVVSNGWGSGYGQHITINHGGGIKTLYAHLSKIYVSPGEAVAKGQTIGMMGCTGWCTGTHLHFEVFVSGRKVNPLSYL